MARFGICAKNTLGVSIPVLRKMAQKSKRAGGQEDRHKLAIELWKSGIHEARILASMIDDPDFVTEKQMDSWIKDFDSWDICDQVCSNLFDGCAYAHKKALEWSKRTREFEKRAGFALMAALSVHDKKAKDETFLRLLPVIIKNSGDERNFVKKAVNWALRQIGKRNSFLNKAAIKAAKEILKKDSKSAKWIAKDALRELNSAAVQKRLRTKN